MDTIKTNKEFYDKIADVYEKVDGRRGEDTKWLDDVIKKISDMSGGGTLLDIGCGTGFVMRKAKKYFKNVYGIDVSKKALEFTDDGVCGEAGRLPFKDETFDVVTCVAVLHHIDDHKRLLEECRRVLKKGGILYTDHDIEKRFVQIWYPMVMLHRWIFDEGKRFMRENKNVTREMFKMSEVHSNGIDGRKFVKMLKEVGFDVDVKYHWIGLSKWMKIMGGGYPRGFAPNIRMMMVK